MCYMPFEVSQGVMNQNFFLGVGVLEMRSEGDHCLRDVEAY